VSVPRLVIAGTHSGVGKTSIAVGLMAALCRRGLRVQPFKIGPDFIDPSFHRLACGRASRNLDGWMLSRKTNLDIFATASKDAHVAVVEGVMGLFDGRDPLDEAGSTAEMAKWLGAPVVLVTDTSAMARSAAALVRGFECFDPELDVSAVLCNRVGGPGHADILRDAIQSRCQSTPLGFLPRDESIALPERHLGLVMADEILSLDRLDALVAWIEASTDIHALLKLAEESSREIEGTVATRPAMPVRVRIGVARDQAFCFYYQDNLDLLAANGAELVEFSPLADADLPGDLSGLYLGGGYPEIHAAGLSTNEGMRSAILEFAKAGGPIYAECGGFMYLTEAIVDAGGVEHPMAGLFPTRARMQNGLAALGYLEAETTKGDRIRGHEFRYSLIDPMPPSVARYFTLHGRRGEQGEGYCVGRVLAGYAHLHFRSCPDFVTRFVQSCVDFKNHENTAEN